MKAPSLKSTNVFVLYPQICVKIYPSCGAADFIIHKKIKVLGPGRV